MRQVWIFTGALAAALSSAAFGGAEVKGKGVEVVTPPAIISEAGQTVRDQRRLPGQVLRCWQDGRLLYEAGGFRVAPERISTAIAVPRAVEGEPVTILDLKKGMCILSSH